MNAKQKILLLTYAKFAYMQNLRICKSPPCVQGFRPAGKLNLNQIIYLKHHWCRGKAALGFGPDRIGTLVAMATDNSHRVIIGKLLLVL